MMGLNLGSASADKCTPHGLLARYTRHCPVFFKSFSIISKSTAFIAVKTLFCLTTSPVASLYAVLGFRLNSGYFLSESAIFKSTPESAFLMSYQCVLTEYIPQYQLD